MIPCVTARAGGTVLWARVFLVAKALTGGSGQSRVHYFSQEYIISDVSSADCYDVIANTPLGLCVKKTVLFE